MDQATLLLMVIAAAVLLNLFFRIIRLPLKWLVKAALHAAVGFVALFILNFIGSWIGVELEMNALNTQWDLMLTHPYRDGGRSVTGWDMKGLQTAVYVSGEVNNPSADNRFWSVEIKIPFSSLMETYSREENPPDLERCYPCRQAPKTGEFWRMNFSRVQWTVEKKSAYKKVTDENGKWRPEDNWVWAPTGLIDIHCPEFWGFVFFTENGENYPILQDEKRKLDLRSIYYAQYVYRRRTGSFTSDLRALDCPLPVYPVTCEATSRTFLLSCDSEEKGCRVYLRDDGYTFTEVLQHHEEGKSMTTRKPEMEIMQ